MCSQISRWPVSASGACVYERAAVHQLAIRAGAEVLGGAPPRTRSTLAARPCHAPDHGRQRVQPLIDPIKPIVAGAYSFAQARLHRSQGLLRRG